MGRCLSTLVNCSWRSAWSLHADHPASSGAQSLALKLLQPSTTVMERSCQRRKAATCRRFECCRIQMRLHLRHPVHELCACLPWHSTGEAALQSELHRFLARLAMCSPCRGFAQFRHVNFVQLNDSWSLPWDISDDNRHADDDNIDDDDGGTIS